MEEISTPVETASVDTSAATEPVTTETSETTATEPTQPTEATAETTTEEGNQEPEQPETTVEEKLYAGKYKSIEDLEKGYKEAEKSFNKVAELEKRIKEFEEKQPKYVTQEGKIDPKIKAQFDYQVDNAEFSEYQKLARSLDAETRTEVERLLDEASSLYSLNRKSEYKRKLAEAKNYFDSEINESIFDKRKTLEAQAQEQIRNYEQKEYNRKANECAQKVKETPELYNLVNKESPDFKPEVLQLLDAVFDAYQDVDIPQIMKVINTVKDLGVKEYLKKQEFEQKKQQASVGQGNNVTANKPTGLPSREELIADPTLYEKTINRMAGNDYTKRSEIERKLDGIIMKG